MDATKIYPLSHGDKRTYELEDKEFWDDLFSKRAEWLRDNGFSEGLRTYNFMDGPFSSIATEYLDYFPESTVRDLFNPTDYSFKEYAEKVMQYRRRFWFLGRNDELPPVMFRGHGLDSSKFTFEVEIDFSDDFGMIRKSIENQCQKIIEAVKEHKSVQWSYCEYPVDYLRDKNAKKIPPEKLFSLWEKCIEMHLKYKKTGNKSQVSRDMGMFNEYNPGSSVDMVTRYLEYANRLITSAGNGIDFFQEAAKPLTSGKVRKEKERKRNK